MAENQLREFFRQKTTRARPRNLNWARKRDQWIRAVDALYRTIEKLLGNIPNVTVRREVKTIQEEEVGEYRVRQLLLRVGDEEVIFSPKGINIVGASGRIDVVGELGTGTIVQQSNGWRIVASRTPSLRLVPLNAVALSNLLRGIMRP